MLNLKRRYIATTSRNHILQASLAQITYFLFNAILFLFGSPVQINIILSMLQHKLIQLLDAIQLYQPHKNHLIMPLANPVNQKKEIFRKKAKSTKVTVLKAALVKGDLSFGLCIMNDAIVDATLDCHTQDKRIRSMSTKTIKENKQP